jgi:hypothetical protein
MSNDQRVQKIALPFRIGIDPMERLLVASFKGDPEFEMIEPQIFDDPVNGKGMRVLRYRTDQKVDVYWQPGVKTDWTTISIGGGIGDFQEVNIEPARFEITDRGIDLHLVFTDAQKRKVEFKILENTIVNNRFPLLAPVGKDIDNPLRLFLVYMHEFDFVRKKDTKVLARIGDRELLPVSFPILRNYQKVILMRYSAAPVVGTINPPMDMPVVFEVTGPGSVEVDGMRVSVDEYRKTTQITVGQELRKVQVDFDPGFPNLLDLPEGTTEEGRWTFRISDTVITGGSYNLLRNGDSVAVEVDVTEAWKPSGLPLSFEIFTQLVRSFRSWPTTYKWKGIVRLNDTLTMDGSWICKGKR